MKLTSNIAAGLLLFTIPCQPAQEATGLAPEVTDLNAKDASYQLEQTIPDLENPYISGSPADLKDGIPVGELDSAGIDRAAILAFTKEIAEGQQGETDSFLLYYQGKLILESYYRRGRIDFPHYQMSITKSYTAMALGRAIQLGHLTMADLDKPVLSFLTGIDKSNLAKGAESITLGETMNMKSGIRVDKNEAVKIMRNHPEKLKGEGQIQTWLELSAPIPAGPREFKYQGSDPSITMQVVERVVPGTAADFIKTELTGKMGITTYGWQTDVSDLPKSAAGSSMRSRDMLKWGILTMNGGRWNGEPFIPAEFVAKATSKIHTNPRGTSYGFFWWRHDMQVGERSIDCITGRGAGGQFIIMIPELDLISVVTAHNKGMGTMLNAFPKKILPAFIGES